MENAHFYNRPCHFFQTNFNTEGTCPDPNQVEDLQNASEPHNASEVQSLLRMANYSRKYIKDFAAITAPLRELTKKNVHFKWERKH